MPERPADADHHLESRLRSLAPLIAYPETPNVAASVTLAEGERDAPRRFRSWQSGFLAATAALVVLGVMLGFSASTREAVGRWLEIPGIRISLDRHPQNDASGPDVRASLGEQITLAEAIAGVSFAVMVPDPALIGDPDEVYGSEDASERWITLVYLADASLSELVNSDIALLITQKPSHPDEVWAQKELGGTTTMSIVHVNGTEALWIEGTHNLNITADEVDRNSRLAGNVLAWHTNGITFRIESNLPLERVLELAESLRPVSASGT